MGISRDLFAHGIRGSWQRFILVHGDEDLEKHVGNAGFEMT